MPLRTCDPAKVIPELADASSLKRRCLRGWTCSSFVELVGGIYFGQPRGEGAAWTFSWVSVGCEVVRLGGQVFWAVGVNGPGGTETKAGKVAAGRWVLRVARHPGHG